MMTPRLLILAGVLAALPLYAVDTRLIRDTEALTPEEERAKLHVPEGFEVQLFASEPMINKPINMAFDTKGRVWVSSTVEYPYSAAKDRWEDEKGTRVRGSRDAIKILEDTDGDGKADKVTTFVDGLNIPTGVLPWHKPEHADGCIAWSIPNIWYFADTDGDGKADLREVLFGPLGYEKDTHGMCSSFRLGQDGWVYATHGFNNTSHFKAKDGSTLDLHSGNVFRFRPDGSHVEIWSWGQVNPFGLCFDQRGNLYSADCHSAPVYQLLHGAYYPSFGKPHDGLGYGPVMCAHSHGSTGICGLVYIDGGVWGPQWDNHTFIGNVVTSRVNHDHITFAGTTPTAHEAPDLVISDDPWFRPVDLQLGPDHALYIADFYNKIIGHYEVPLDNPGRDKERGRIWRVVKKGATGNLAEWARRMSNPIQVKALLINGTPVQRRMAIRSLVEEAQKPNPEQKGSDCGVGEEARMAREAEHYAWINLQAGTAVQRNNIGNSAAELLAGKNLLKGFWSARLLGSMDTWTDEQAMAILAALHIWPVNQPLTLRAITEAIGSHPAPLFVAPLVGLLDKIPADDASFRHVVMIALRNCMETPGGSKELSAVMASAGIRNSIFQVATSTKTTDAAKFVFAELPNVLGADNYLQGLKHIARYGDPGLLTMAIAYAKKRETDSIALVDAFESLHNGLAERGGPESRELLAWGQELAQVMLKNNDAAAEQSWTAVGSAGESPWTLQKRKCADGQMVDVISSLRSGEKNAEQLTGILRSKAFVVPAKLSLWICGHQGYPQVPANQKNLVRLVDADSHDVLQQAFPPRSDVCQKVEWNLAQQQGRKVRLEIVDGDDGKSYAWLGVTRIEPSVVSIESFLQDDRKDQALRTLAMLLQHTAPAALRDQLTAYLPPRPAPPPLPVSPEQSKQLDSLIAARISAFKKASPEVARGQQIFMTNCSACHQIGGQGGLIGPQLDGIGNRGPERLCEDILDPNRNVDAHFHIHTLTFKDGTVMSGFVKGEAGQVLIMAEATGREHRVTKTDLTKDETTPMSLMPPLFGQTIAEKDFLDLLGWLLKR